MLTGGSKNRFGDQPAIYLPQSGLWVTNNPFHSLPHTEHTQSPLPHTLIRRVFSEERMSARWALSVGSRLSSWVTICGLDTR